MAGSETPRIAVSGASGLIGSALQKALLADGHAVVPIVRRASASPGEIVLDGTRGLVGADHLAGVTAVVHLAGAPISQRWTATRQAEIRASRVEPTRLLAEAIARLPSPPPALICASAVGFYGDRGEVTLDESAPAGQGFLAEVCQAWEDACRPASEAGARVVHLRSGIVLDRRGGALPPLLRVFRLGLGGRIGNGRQWMSYISLTDEVRAIRHAIANTAVTGPVNLVAPTPVRNAVFASTLGRVLRRPALLPTPALAVRLALGQMGRELLLASQRALPQRLAASGFVFDTPELEAALRSALA